MSRPFHLYSNIEVFICQIHTHFDVNENGLVNLITNKPAIIIFFIANVLHVYSFHLQMDTLGIGGGGEGRKKIRSKPAAKSFLNGWRCQQQIQGWGVGVRCGIVGGDGEAFGCLGDINDLYQTRLLLIQFRMERLISKQ